MVQVYPNILVGNKGAAENTDLLTELGISHLLNCAGGARRGNILTGSGKVRPELGGRNIEYKELALRVEMKPKPPHHLGDFALQDTPGENILSVLDDTTDWMERVVAVIMTSVLTSPQTSHVRTRAGSSSTVLWAPVAPPQSRWPFL